MDIWQVEVAVDNIHLETKNQRNKRGKGTYCVPKVSFSLKFLSVSCSLPMYEIAEWWFLKSNLFSPFLFANKTQAEYE